MGKQTDKRKIVKSILICLLLLAAATGAGYLFQNEKLSDTTIVMLYMISVLLAASMTEGYLYGIIEAFLATGAFNYFFVLPYYSLNIDNPSYAVTMFSMLFTAVITSMLTSKAKVNEKEAKEREKEALLLLELTNRVTEAKSMKELAENIVKYAGSILKCRVACMVTDDDGSLYGRFLYQDENGNIVWEGVKEKEELEAVFCGAHPSEYRDGLHYRFWAVYGQEGLLGALGIPLEEAVSMGETRARMFASVKETIRLGMERLYVLRRQMRDKAMMEKERYRSTLLRSISHDLRTPLAEIMGTSEILLDMLGEEEQKRKLLADISQDAQWLYELVQNVLSLTRLQDGELIHKEPEACEEVIETAVRRIHSRSTKHKIQVQIPEECLIAPMDVRLVEQVLINMLDNAVKHTPENSEIFVSVKKQGAEAVFEVKDNGKGISYKDFPYIFQSFYTTHKEEADKKKGMGLGLAICQSIVKAHGGKISAVNREDGNGAIFRFTIPMEESA